MYWLDHNVENLVRIFDQNERKDFLRLDLNENPGGLPREFVESVLAEVTPQMVAQYPETLHFTQVLADYIGTDITNICITNGSAEAIRYVIQAFTASNGRIVGVVPSYFMFQVYSEMYGRNFVKVPYNDDLTISIDNIERELTDDTQMLILLNPNNPMGNVYSDEEFERLFKTCQEKEITLLIDEAYHYFYPNTFLKYALNEENVVLLRTFSKLFSIAACRLGVVISNPQIIHYVKNAKLTFDANAIALLFAERILDHPEMIEQLIETEKEGKAYTLAELTKHGYETRDCRGNFIFVTPKHQATEVAQKLETEKKILVKSYGNEMLKKYLRISVGSKDAMERFLTAFFEIDERA